MGLRERKKQATRQALALTALRLAVERGYDRVLVEDIAAEVGVSPRTFNNYFGGKAEAICALAVHRSERIGDALRARPPGEPLWTALREAVLSELGSGGVPADVPDRVWIAGLRLVVTTPAMQGEYLRAQAATQDALAAAIRERLGGAQPDDLLPEVLGGAVAAACGVAMRRWLWSDPPADLGDLLRRALSLLERA
ncbi:TetR/AcrR family transcriptional regulator [Dactylosporangium sucinum]|uniref:TetR family transcriptional regulator n=1 Tax=Dactylosporangium sucinum TaxID=1424081 RepID=A0A917WSR7_9ACTN|nr:TetR/AcrR family transcriptional regulator [Dactylosporangium sucinum]GGM25272.1 TetR family transcriptional regulator [Dactylosporangium sucinum]